MGGQLAAGDKLPLGDLAIYVRGSECQVFVARQEWGSAIVLLPAWRRSASQGQGRGRDRYPCLTGGSPWARRRKLGLSQHSEECLQAQRQIKAQRQKKIMLCCATIKFSQPLVHYHCSHRQRSTPVPRQFAPILQATPDPSIPRQ